MSTNLPIVWQDKVNSPTLLAYFQQFGEETYLSAEEINQIKRAINELGLPDGFIKTTPLTRVGNVVSIAALDFKWILNHNVLENTIAFSANILPATDGKYRSDILVANTLGSFSLYQGPEDAMSAIQIPTPEDTLFVTVITVYGSNIISIVNTNSSGYITKKEKAVVEIAGGGNSIAVSDESSFFEIAGFTGSINYVYNQGSGYVGKIYTIKNKTGSNLTITHDATSSENNKKFFTFPNSLDFILKPNEQVDFRETGNARLDYIGVITDFTNYYNKTEIDTKISSVLIYKGSVANYAVLPSIGLVIGDVYNLTNTGHNYVWSGYDWDDLGPAVDVSGKEDSSNKSNDIETDKTSTSKYGNIAAWISWLKTYFFSNLTAKVTPILADSLMLGDSADSNKTKKSTIQSIRDLFKTYFDTLYGIIFGIVDVAATTYQLLLTDNGKKVVFSSATAVTLTIPTNVVVALPIGTRIKITQQGNGVVSLVVTGLTIVSSSPLYTIKGQTITLEKTAINTWTIEGNNLNGEIILPAFPNTRNDGKIPTNRILSTDAVGNLKLYTIATAPAPFMEVLIPDSLLPSITTNFTIKGAFFTPTMTVSIVGQTINYITFVSDNLIKVNVTTGAAEGAFDVVLNNGLSATFSKLFLVVLGTVTKLSTSNFTSIPSSIDASDAGFLKHKDSLGGAFIVDGFVIPANKNFRITYSKHKSPLGYSYLDRGSYVKLLANDDNTIFYQTIYHYGNHNTVGTMDKLNPNVAGNIAGGSFYNCTDLNLLSPNQQVTIERVNGVFRFKGENGSVFATSTVNYFGSLKLSICLLNADISNLRYIELAT